MEIKNEGIWIFLSRNHDTGLKGNGQTELSAVKGPSRGWTTQPKVFTLPCSNQGQARTQACRAEVDKDVGRPGGGVWGGNQRVTGGHEKGGAQGWGYVCKSEPECLGDSGVKRTSCMSH